MRIDDSGMCDAFRLVTMSKQQHPSAKTSSETQTEEIAEITDGEHRSRTMLLARRHPLLTVAGVATVGLFGGIELAAGVLLGAGVAALVRGRGSRAVSPQQAVATAESAPAQEEETVGAYVDRMAPEIRKRVKAVMQAVRGQLSPANP